MFELPKQATRGAVIKVIGIGGGGCNAVKYMLERELEGVEYICANTDSQALDDSNVPHKLQLGEE